MRAAAFHSPPYAIQSHLSVIKLVDYSKVRSVCEMSHFESLPESRVVSKMEIMNMMNRKTT